MGFEGLVGGACVLAVVVVVPLPLIQTPTPPPMPILNAEVFREKSWKKARRRYHHVFCIGLKEGLESLRAFGGFESCSLMFVPVDGLLALLSLSPFPVVLLSDTEHHLIASVKIVSISNG